MMRDTRAENMRILKVKQFLFCPALPFPFPPFVVIQPIQPYTALKPNRTRNSFFLHKTGRTGRTTKTRSSNPNLEKGAGHRREVKTINRKRKRRKEKNSITSWRLWYTRRLNIFLISSFIFGSFSSFVLFHFTFFASFWPDFQVSSLYYTCNCWCCWLYWCFYMLFFSSLILLLVHIYIGWCKFFI